MEDGIFKEIILGADADMPAPPAGLTKKILLRIEREERRRFVMKTAVFGAALLGSCLLVGYGWMTVVAEASRSGLLAFASLFVSDFSLATASFSDFILSIVESFPVFPAALFLSGVFFVIWSAARFMNEVMLTRKHIFSVFS